MPVQQSCRVIGFAAHHSPHTNKSTNLGKRNAGSMTLGKNRLTCWNLSLLWSSSPWSMFPDPRPSANEATCCSNTCAIEKCQPPREPKKNLVLHFGKDPIPYTHNMLESTLNLQPCTHNILERAGECELQDKELDGSRLGFRLCIVPSSKGAREWSFSHGSGL
jgi:hypothetical protein